MGTTTLNRWRNNDTVQNVNNHGEQKNGIKAVIEEGDAWHHETYHGEGTLLESQRNRFYNILNGSPDSLDCGGLLNSWNIAQNIVFQFYEQGLAIPNNYPAKLINVKTYPAPRALYYGSANSFDDITLPGVSTVNKQYVQTSAYWQVPKYPSGWYVETFWLLTNAVPRAGFTSFF